MSLNSIDELGRTVLTIGTGTGSRGTLEKGRSGQTSVECHRRP